MKTSFTRDAAVEGKFYFRKDVVTGRICGNLCGN